MAQEKKTPQKDSAHSSSNRSEPKPPSPAPAAPSAAGGEAPAKALSPRTHPRMPMVREVQITELNDQGEPTTSVVVQTFDISRGGLGFYSRKLFLTGRYLLIEIPKAGERVPTFLYGVVRHSRYVTGRGHMVGLELEPIPESAVIMEWVADRIRATTA